MSGSCGARGRGDRDRVEALLGGPDLAWLRARVRQRLERGGKAEGTVTLAEPSAGQRAAVERLLGRRPSRGTRVTVRLDDLDRLLREAEVCDGLRAAITLIEGPIIDVARAKHAEEAAWAGVWDDHRWPDGPAWRRTWRQDLATSGLLRRLAPDADEAGALFEQASKVLAALPAGGMGLARLSADTLHDSHALDGDRPVATLVLKALQHQYLPPDDRGPLPTGADRRALWAAAGVLLDELAAPVLVHGLRVGGHGLLDLTLRSHADAGEPVRLTLRQLLRHPPELATGNPPIVYVCENPAVVSAAADNLGPHSAPLVCTEGQPSSAVQTILRMLTDAGVELAHHGDFDRGGLRIANTVIRRFGARPWRFDTRSYLAAPAGPALGGPVPAVAWAPGLAEAMNARGTAVHEEQLLAQLLDDLDQTPRASRASRPHIS